MSPKIEQGSFEYLIFIVVCFCLFFVVVQYSVPADPISLLFTNVCKMCIFQWVGITVSLQLDMSML